MEIKIVKLSDIKPYFNNPRDNSRAVDPTMKSIQKYSFIKPITVDRDGVIICGHTRYIAAFRLGLTEVPVIYSDMNEELCTAFRIADNKLAELGYFDQTELVEELKKMKAPAEMQSFFFEDINSMLNFSYESMQMPASTAAGGDFNENPYEFLGGAKTAAESVSDYEPEETTAEDNFEPESSSEKVPLYKRMRDEDGREYMYILCPYCNNVEKAYLDE